MNTAHNTKMKLLATALGVAAGAVMAPALLFAGVGTAQADACNNTSEFLMALASFPEVCPLLQTVEDADPYSQMLPPEKDPWYVVPPPIDWNKLTIPDDWYARSQQDTMSVADPNAISQEEWDRMHEPPEFGVLPGGVEYDFPPGVYVP